MAGTHKKIRNVYALTPSRAQRMRNMVIGGSAAMALLAGLLGMRETGDAEAGGLLSMGDVLMQDRLQPEENGAAKGPASRFRQASEERLRALFERREAGLFDHEQEGKGEDYAATDDPKEAEGGAVDPEALKQALADLQPLLEKLGQGQGFPGAPAEGGYNLGMPVGVLVGSAAGAAMPITAAGGGGLLPGAGAGGGAGGGIPGASALKPVPPADPVPVPGAAILMLTGLGALAARKHLENRTA